MRIGLKVSFNEHAGEYFHTNIGIQEPFSATKDLSCIHMEIHKYFFVKLSFSGLHLDVIIHNRVWPSGDTLFHTPNINVMSIFSWLLTQYLYTQYFTSWRSGWGTKSLALPSICQQISHYLLWWTFSHFHRKENYNLIMTDVDSW